MSEQAPSVIGILGAGRIGIAIARRALKKGFLVNIATSRTPEDMEAGIQAAAPGARVVASQVLAHESDIVILAIPLSRYRTLDPGLLTGKVVIDPMNYWPPTEGIIEEFETEASSTEIVQAFLPRARVVRALNHIGYREIESEGRRPGHPDRRALAIAGNDSTAKAEVGRFIEQLGFDAVEAGPLEMARHFEIGTKIFGRRRSRDNLERLLAAYDQKRLETSA